jgi:hypothetical protein
LFRSILSFGPSEFESDPLKITFESAIHTEDAVALLKDLFIKACGADILAGMAIRAELPGQPSKEGKTTQDVEKGAEGTKVFAPIAFFIAFEEEDEEEKQKGNKREGVESLSEWQDIVPEKTIGRLDAVPFVTQK